jgi:diaminohydroxyphosphoribosylaminopyrimidine deaminase/5-amino-6-(5-phosphoribosylamino)uracil reductase
MRDEDYMREAIRLARRGLGRTSPNPMVGAVIVRDGRVIGRGYHRRYGENHAEINAIQDARENVSGSTIYVNLEPCSHHGKTPPCLDAIIGHQFGRVVMGTHDPNPLVNGKSEAVLRQNGIEVRAGVLEEECRLLNEAYFKYISTGLPLVTLKFAQSLDGRIATATGNSRWISSEKFRRLAHRRRAASDAVMVGIDTILADDPQLTVRLVRGKNPVRVILDSRLRIPLEAGVITGGEVAPTIIATTSRADAAKKARLGEMGIEVLVVPESGGGEVDLKSLLGLLGGKGITSVLVEGGAGVITSFLRQGLADKMMVAIAPRIIGQGIEAVGELDIAEVSRSLRLSFNKVYRCGEDLVVEARLKLPAL